MDDLPNYSLVADNGDLDNIEQGSLQPSVAGLGQRTRGATPTATHQRPTEFVSTLKDNTNFPWISLILKSDSHSSGLPHFLGGRPIQGRVVLDLAKPQSITSVLVTIKGLFYCGLYETTTFYSESKVLWRAPDVANDTSPSASSSLGFRSAKITKRNTAKLGGRHVWPFHFTLPHEFRVEKTVAKDYKLQLKELMPPTMDGDVKNSSIDYMFVIDVKRRGITQFDATLPARFSYTPFSKPLSASVLRNEAYLAEEEPLGPEGDTKGWITFAKTHLRGTLFHTRPVLIGCSVALAVPLSYTRGSVIPCFLTIRCNDPQALQIFSSPNAPVVHLKAKLKFRASTNDMERRTYSDGLVRGASMPSVKAPLSVAVWKVANSDTDDCDPDRSSTTRQLYGELSLPSKLVPSFTFGQFEAKYVVEVQQFNVAGFVNDSKSCDHLARCEVEIVAEYGEGPRPRAYLPPGYITAREKANAASTNNSVG